MIFKELNTVVALCGAVVLAACSSSSTPVSDNNNVMQPSVPSADGPVQSLFVKHHKSECLGVGPQLCMLVRSTEQDEWGLFYDGIEGFEFEWGYNYELLISVHEVPDPPADGSSREYRLIRTVSKKATPAESTFDFPSVYAPELIQKANDNTFRLGFEQLLSCTPTDCQTMASLLEQQFSIFFELKYSPDPTAPLQLAQIKCSDTEISFRENCLP